jgi:fibronectin type 3 domain-containing protein
MKIIEPISRNGYRKRMSLSFIVLLFFSLFISMNSNQNISVVSDSKKVFQTSWPESQGTTINDDGILDIGFNEPIDVEVGMNGRIYVADSALHAVFIMDQYNNLIDKIGSNGDIASSAQGEFDTPVALAFNSTGFLYVVDQGNDRIQVFDQDGGFQYSFGSTGSNPGQFNHPLDIAIDSADRVYVVDRSNCNVSIFNPDGTFYNGWSYTGALFAGGMVLDENYIYITDVGGTSMGIYTYDYAGNKIGDTNYGLGHYPSFMTINSTGHIFFVDDDLGVKGIRIWKNNTSIEVFADEEAGRLGGMSFCYPNKLLVCNISGQYIRVFESPDWESTKGQIPPSPPDAPTLQAFNPSIDDDGNIDLNWNSVDGAQSYNIYQSSSYFTDMGQATLIETVYSPYHSLLGLSNGFYYFAVTAVNSVGESVLSNCEGVQVSFFINPPSAPSLNPIYPEISTDGLIYLTWYEVVDANYYNIYQCDQEFSDISSATSMDIAYPTYYTVYLSENGTYYFAVTAVNDGGESGLSNLVSVQVTIQLIPPTAPSLDPIYPEISTDGQICLTWYMVEGVTNYKIYQSNNEFSDISSATFVDSTDQPYYTIYLTDNGTYYFAVTAVNAWGESELSNLQSVQVEITIIIPAAPTLDAITPTVDSDGQISLTWSIVEGVTNYKIYRST